MRVKRVFLSGYGRFCAALILGCMVINPAIAYAEDIDPPPLDAPIDDEANDEETEAEKAAAKAKLRRSHIKKKFDKDYEFSRKLIDALDHARNVSLFAGATGAFIGLLLMWFFAGVAPAGAWWQWVLVVVLAVGSQHAAQRFSYNQSEAVKEAIYGAVQLENKSIARYTVQTGHLRNLSESMRESLAQKDQKLLADAVTDHREKYALISEALVRIDRFKSGRFHSAWFLKYGLGTGGFAVILLILTSIITRRVPGLAG